MEVWLESLSMHLSVGIPLPSDLLFDIQHYKGASPSSSGSTTPDNGHRSPALEPIREIKTTPKNNDKKPLIQISCESAKPVQTSDAKKPDPYPNYENIDFLKNDSAFAAGGAKELSVKNLGKGNNTQKKSLDNNMLKFPVSLRTVPKNFTRNHFNRVNAEKPEFLERRKLGQAGNALTAKVLNLDKSEKCSKGIPDLVSSTLKPKAGSSSGTFSINRSIFKKFEPSLVLDSPRLGGRKLRLNNLTLVENRTTLTSGSGDTASAPPSSSTAAHSTSNSIVKSIIDTLNRKEKSKGDSVQRNFNGRRSLKVGEKRNKMENSPKFRSCSSEEFTAL